MSKHYSFKHFLLLCAIHKNLPFSPHAKQNNEIPLNEHRNTSAFSYILATGFHSP